VNDLKDNIIEIKQNVNEFKKDNTNRHGQIFDEIKALQKEISKIDKKNVLVSAIVYFIIYIAIEVIKAIAPMIIRGGK